MHPTAHRLLPALLLGAALLLTLAAPPRAPAGPLPLGASQRLAGCLRLTVLGLTERAGSLTRHDWVTVRLVNDCDVPVRHVLAELYLVGERGAPYGARHWLLGRGEVLRPGRAKTARYPIPDPQDVEPAQWQAAVLHMETPRRQAPPSRARRPG